MAKVLLVQRALFQIARVVRPWLRFRTDTRANIAMMFGLLAVPIVGLVGLGVDTAMSLRARNILALAAQGAGTLCASNIRFYTNNNVSDPTTQAIADAAAYFNSQTSAVPNFVATSPVSISANVVSGSQVTCTVTFQGTIPTSFSRVLGFNTIGVGGTDIGTTGIGTPAIPFQDTTFAENFENLPSTQNLNSNSFADYKNFLGNADTSRGELGWYTLNSSPQGFSSNGVFPAGYLPKGPDGTTNGYNYQGVEIGSFASNVYNQGRGSGVRAIPTPPNSYNVAELDANGNTSMSKPLLLRAGRKYEIRYSYLSRVYNANYAPLVICGSTSADVDWANLPDEYTGHVQTNRIGVYFDFDATFKPTNIAPPAKYYDTTNKAYRFDPTTNNLIDVCVESAMQWTTRSITVTPNNTGLYWLTFQAEGASDSLGGLIDNVLVCPTTCTGNTVTYKDSHNGGNVTTSTVTIGSVPDPFPFAPHPIGVGANTTLYWDEFQIPYCDTGASGCSATTNSGFSSTAPTPASTFDTDTDLGFMTFGTAGPAAHSGQFYGTAAGWYAGPFNSVGYIGRGYYNYAALSEPYGQRWITRKYMFAPGVYTFNVVWDSHATLCEVDPNQQGGRWTAYTLPYPGTGTNPVGEYKNTYTLQNGGVVFDKVYTGWQSFANSFTAKKSSSTITSPVNISNCTQVHPMYFNPKYPNDLYMEQDQFSIFFDNDTLVSHPVGSQPFGVNQVYNADGTTSSVALQYWKLPTSPSIGTSDGTMTSNGYTKTSPQTLPPFNTTASFVDPVNAQIAPQALMAKNIQGQSSPVPTSATLPNLPYNTLDAMTYNNAGTSTETGFDILIKKPGFYWISFRAEGLTSNPEYGALVSKLYFYKWQSQIGYQGATRLTPYPKGATVPCASGTECIVNQNGKTSVDVGDTLRGSNGSFTFTAQ